VVQKIRGFSRNHRFSGAKNQQIFELLGFPKFHWGEILIISKTPLRISFAGGGTDLPDYYRRHSGAVVSTTINKYVYVTVNKRFDDSIRVSYSKTEIVDDFEDIRHELVRESMRLVGLKKGLEITTISDIPSGTGVGSSSALTVGLLNALYAFTGQHKSAETLARDACKIEIDVLKNPIGKQDQYIAAYGGLLFIEFNRDDSVFVNRVIARNETKRLLDKRLMMFYTGITRSANKILKEQKKNTKNNTSILNELKSLAYSAKECLFNGKTDELGNIMDKGWHLKKQLAFSISNPAIDSYYEKARKAGAVGGKVAGAGGGGFVLLYCHEKYMEKVINALRGLRLIPFRLEPQGSRIIYVGD